MKLTDTVLNEYLKKLGEAKDIVLSMCAGDRVTSRTVSCACFGEEILFLNWGHHTKCKQISENPNVALTSITSWTQDSQGYCIEHIDLGKREIQRVRPTDEYEW